MTTDKELEDLEVPYGVRTLLEKCPHELRDYIYLLAKSVDTMMDTYACRGDFDALNRQLEETDAELEKAETLREIADLRKAREELYEEVVGEIEDATERFRCLLQGQDYA